MSDQQETQVVVIPSNLEHISTTGRVQEDGSVVLSPGDFIHARQAVLITHSDGQQAKLDQAEKISLTDSLVFNSEIDESILDLVETELEVEKPSEDVTLSDGGSQVAIHDYQADLTDTEAGYVTSARGLGNSEQQNEIEKPGLIQSATNTSNTVIEDQLLSVTGQFQNSASFVSFQIVGQAKDQYGELVLDGKRGWTYQLANNSMSVQSLAQGESLTKTFQVELVDAYGRTQFVPINIQVQGTNDLPQISGASTGSVVEDVLKNVSGQLNVSDVDTLDSHTWSVSGTGQGNYGSLSIDTQTGKWIYTLDKTSQATQSLAFGQTVTESFIVNVDDGKGGVVPQSVTITIDGTNDTPIISGTTQGTVTEDALLTKSGRLNVSDVDAGDTHIWLMNSSGTGSYGSFNIDAKNGQWTYTLDNSNLATQALSQGQIVKEVFYVSVDDGNGGITTQRVLVDVVGSNDRPTISGTASGAVTEDQVGTTSGQLRVHDLDANDVHAWSIQGSGQGAFGSISVNAQTGKWEYKLDHSNPATQALSQGQIATETFYVKVDDGQGGTRTQAISVQVNGTNDTPSISGTSTGGVIEDASINITSGQLQVQDVDKNDVHAWTLNGSGQGSYGQLSIDPNTGRWTYTLDNNLTATQSIAKDDVKTESFTVEVSDGQGGTATQLITVNVTGTNDAPAVIGGDLTATFTEGQYPTIRGKTPIVQDVDTGDTLSFSWENQHSSSNGTGLVLGKWGNYIIDETTGTWGANFHNSLVNTLSAGEVVTETVMMKVTDQHGATTDQAITVTIIGTNDVPQIIGQFSGIVTEDLVNSAKGNLQAVDPDRLDTHSWALQGNGQGTYGSISINPQTGTWQYQLDNGLLATQALSAGQIASETFIVQVDDGHGGTATQRITVDVTGTNDRPNIGGTSTGFVSEDGKPSAGGMLRHGDVDAGDTHTWSLGSGQTSFQGQYGTFTIASNGVWRYQLDNSHPDVQKLAAGESLTDSVIANVADQLGATDSQSIGITINGTNDNPVIAGQITGQTKEDTIKHTSGQLTVTDADASDTHVWSLVGTGRGTYGVLQLGPNGQWTYDMFDGSRSKAVNGLREGETRTETFQIQVDDGHGGIVTQSVSIIVEGTNDSPAIRGRATGSVIEDQVETVSGRLRDGDPDRGDTHTWSIDGGGADQYGQLTVDQNGRWRYTLDRTSPDTQGLGDGESVTVQHTVRVIDSQGAASTKVVSVVINGTNDKPLMAGQFSGTAKEDVTPTISGQLTPDDADKNDTHSWRVLNPNASYGSLSIDGQGKWTFSLHPNSESVNALSEGQVIQQTFRVEVRDQHGERTIKQVVIDVEGTNDLPTIRGQNTGSVTEDLIGQTSGSLTAVDVDALDTHTWKVVGSQQGRFGGLTIDPNNGKWTFVLDHNSPDTKALGHGQKTTESFIVEVDDGHGGKAQQIITVEIIGNNTAPNIGGVSSGFLKEDVQTQVSGKLTHGDPDIGDTHTWSLVGTAKGSYGSLSLGPDGQWTYKVDGRIDQLREGQAKTETFTIMVTDSYGHSSQQTVTVNLEGTNDVPNIGGVQAASTVEDAQNPVGGRLQAGDPDRGDTHTWTVGGGGQSITNSFGTFTLQANGQWSFLIDNRSQDVQTLKDGEIKTLSFPVETEDSQGAKATSFVTVTVTGTNDAPLIIAPPPSQMTLLEDGAQTQLSGTLSTSDVDKGDTATFTPGTFKGTYGTFTIDANGNWTYTLDNGANATQALAQGQIATESFAVVATDQSGASVSKVISMNLVGTNDVPTVNGIATGTTVENLQLNAVGFLQATDVDTGDKITQWRVLNPNGTYGSLSIDQNGKWIYTLDNNDADTKALKAGQTGQEAFQVVAVDLSGGTSQPFSINVDVIGTQNRAPGGGGTPPSGVTTTHPTIVANVIENTKPKDSGSFSGAPGTALKDPEFKAPDENSSPTRVGNNADNHIKGTNKQDFIDGRGGNDRIDGGDKDDRIHGGDGNDQLKGGKGDDVLRGGSGNDLLDGGSANKGDTAEFTGSRSEYRIVDLGNGQFRVIDTIPGRDGTDTVKNIEFFRFANGTYTDSNVQSGSPIPSTVGSYQSVSAHPVVGGAYGALTVDANTGKWTYTLNNSPQTEALAEGQQVTETWKIVMIDANGHRHEQTVNVDIQGTNDAPTIIGQDSGRLVEGSLTQSSGSLAALDPDAGDTHTWSLNGGGQGNFGTLTLNPNTGQWEYKLDSNSPAVQALQPGVTVQDVFTVQVTDANGDTATKQIVMSIDGTAQNQVVSSGQIVDTGAAIEDNKVTDQGSLPNTFNGTLVTWTLVSGQGQLGSMNFDKTTGKWTYTLNGQVANSMPEGLTTKESFMVIPVDQFGKTMVDSNGQAVTVLIEIDVTGTNDAPDIQGRLNGSMKNAESSVEGQLQSGDPDQGDTHTWSLNGNNGSYGSMQLNASSGKWEYTLDKNHPDVLALGKGQSLTETFMVTVTDQHGDSSTKAITLNVTGENKAPVISGVTAGDVKEDVKGLHTAKANITDPNTGDTVEIIPKTQNGLFGQFTIDQQGNWQYQINENASNVDALREGQTRTETFLIQGKDNHGATVSQVITVTVEGTNDVPQISGTTTQSMSETQSTSTGQLIAVDPDIGDSHTWSVKSGGSYGTLVVDANGKWTYTLDASNPAVQGLASGQSMIDHITVEVRDASSGVSTQVIDVTINGANSQPNIQGVVQGLAVEDQLNAVTGQLQHGDPDQGDTHTWSLVGGGQSPWGSMQVDANGKWTFVLNQNKAQHLGDGETHELAFQIKVADQHNASDTQTVKVVINGTNDAPQISGVSIGNVQENGTLRAEGQLQHGDVDANDTHTWKVLAGGLGAFGVMTVDAQGKWTYVLDQNKAQALSDGQTATETFQIEVQDQHGERSVQTVNVHVDGANDVPQITGTDTGRAIEGSSIAAAGSWTAVDPDALDQHTWSVATPAQYGTLTIDANGNWSYVLHQPNHADIDQLADGELKTDTAIIQVDDGHGSIVTQQVTLTITGTNDAPNISGVLSGTVQDGGTLQASGQLLDGDVDASDMHTWNILGSQQGQYGVISLDASGKWVYQLDPAKAESLAKGETAQETFQVEVLDQHGERSVAQIRVEVVGSNDLPSVAPVVQQSVAENATTPISGTLQVIDPDVSDQHAWRSVNTSQYGQFSLNAQTGAWEYRLNTAHPDVQKLLTGQTLRESIIVEVDDGLGGTATQTIAIEIDGQGNAPVAVIDNSHLNAGGIDTGNVFANDQADTSLTLTGINGQSLQFDPVSGWSQVFDTGHALVQFKANGSFEAQAKTGNSNLQTVTESLQYEAQDQSGVTATGSMDVHTDAAQQVIAPPPPPLAPVSGDVPAVSYDSDPLLLLDQVTAPSGKSEATRSSFIQESLVDLAPELEPKESVSDLLSGLPESSNDKDSAGNADTAQTNEQESNRKAGAWDVGHSVNLDSLLPDNRSKDDFE